MTRIIQAAQDRKTSQECVLARQAIANILREEHWSYKQIAKSINVVGTTVMAYCHHHQHDYDNHELYTRIYDEAKSYKEEIIQKYISSETGLIKETSELIVLSESRTRLTSNKLARRAISKILRDAGWTFKKIGEALNYDHSTITHHCKKHDDEYKHYGIYTKIYDSVERCKEEIQEYYGGTSKNERLILLNTKADERLCELAKQKRTSISKIIEELILKERNGL